MRLLRSHRNRKSAFTLFELLVVMAIFLILVLLSLGVVNSARDKMKSSQCMSNLRALGQIIFSYAVDHNQDLLPGIRYNSPARTSGNPWYYELDETGILPFSEWEKRKKSVMRCPSRTTEPFKWFESLHYGMSLFPGFINGTIPGQAAFKLSRVESPSRTALIGEVQKQYLVYPWTGDYNAFPHKDHMNILFVDGHGEVVKGPLPKVIKSAGTANVPYDGDPFPFY